MLGVVRLLANSTAVVTFAAACAHFQVLIALAAIATLTHRLLFNRSAALSVETVKFAILSIVLKPDYVSFQAVKQSFA